MAYRDTLQAESAILNYWPMNGDGTALVGGVNLTVSGAVSAAGQVDGTALQFDGVDDFARSASTIDLSARSKLVVEFLLNPGPYANNDDMALEFTANGTLNAGGFYVNPNSGVPYSGSFAVATNGNVGITSAGYARPAAGVWHHFAVVLDYAQAGTNECNMYVDGVLATATGRIHNNNNTGTFANSTLYVMCRNAASLFGAGKMQHLAIYSDLSAARIAAHAAAALPGSVRPGGHLGGARHLRHLPHVFGG